MNDGEMSTRRNNEIPEISVLRQPRWIQTKEEKNSERDGLLIFQEKQQLKDEREASLIQVKEWRDEQRDVDRRQTNPQRRRRMIERSVCKVETWVKSRDVVIKSRSGKSKSSSSKSSDSEIVKSKSTGRKFSSSPSPHSIRLAT